MELAVELVAQLSGIHHGARCRGEFIWSNRFSRFEDLRQHFTRHLRGMTSVVWMLVCGVACIYPAGRLPTEQTFMTWRALSISMVMGSWPCPRFDAFEAPFVFHMFLDVPGRIYDRVTARLAAGERHSLSLSLSLRHQKKLVLDGLLKLSMGFYEARNKYLLA